MKKADCLKEIIAKKKEKISLSKQNLPEEDLRLKVKDLPATRPFIEAINKPKNISLIAEIKKQSPSQGLIRENFDPVTIALGYQEAGVQAISVLTEEDFFAGSLDYLNLVKQAVNLPLLRKDFIIEPYQILESRYFGADAILLISDLLSKDALSEMIGLADSLGLDCLVESHEEKDLKRVLTLKVSPLISTEEKPAGKDKKNKFVVFAVGINNRNLHTLEVDIKNTERLYPLVSKDRIVVVESGIKSCQDVLFLKILGVNAILVGESILRADDLKTKIQDLMGW